MYSLGYACYDVKATQTLCLKWCGCFIVVAYRSKDVRKVLVKGEFLDSRVEHLLFLIVQLDSQSFCIIRNVFHIRMMQYCIYLMQSQSTLDARRTALL